jgi:hypothetical protein
MTQSLARRRAQTSHQAPAGDQWRIDAAAVVNNVRCCNSRSGRARIGELEVRCLAHHCQMAECRMCASAPTFAKVRLLFTSGIQPCVRRHCRSRKLETTMFTAREANARPAIQTGPSQYPTSHGGSRGPMPPGVTAAAEAPRTLTGDVPDVAARGKGWLAQTCATQGGTTRAEASRRGSRWS